MFKKLIMSAFVLMIVIAAKADGSQKVPSKVQKVVVFLNGAQVTRTAMVNVSEGTTDLVFGDISPDIDVQSIQVNANGEFTILSVKHETNFLNEKVKIKEVEDLQAAQKTIRDKIDLQNAMLTIYQQEETILSKNQFVKAENASLDVIKLKEALDFQTERLTSLKVKEQTVKNQIEALQTELQKYDRQIADLNGGQKAATTNVIVTVSSKTMSQSIFSLSYMIHNANWFPSYDIRAKNVNSPLTIVYKANVSQKSGEDWKNVKLTLSTGSPSVNGVKPKLNPYYLNFYTSYLGGQAAGANLSEVVVAGYGTKDKKETYAVETIPVSVNQVENQTDFEFNIDNPYSVSSDGKQCQ